MAVLGSGEYEHPVVWHNLYGNPMPLKVALLSIASDTSIGREIVSRLNAFGFESASIVDLSDVLTVPIDLPDVREELQGMDGSHVRVQRLIMCNDDYPSVMHTLLKNSMSGAKNDLRVFIRADVTGIKSDVVCRAEKEALNKLTFNDGDGPWPLFYAVHFQMLHARTSDIDSFLNAAFEWVTVPEYVRPRASIDPAASYGFGACRPKPEDQ